MYKKIIGVVVILALITSLVACGEDITISIEDLDIEMMEGDTYQIDFDTNDGEGLHFESGDEGVLTVSSSGQITAVSEGETTIVVSSTNDPEVTLTVTVKVNKNYTLTVPSDEVTIKVGESKLIEYTSNDDVTFQSADDDIFTVDATGMITAVSEGKANLTIQAVSDSSLLEIVEIDVRKIVTLSVDAEEESLWIGKDAQLTYESNDDVAYETGDATIATVSADGLVTAVSAGHVTITVRSTYDLDVFEEVLVKVYNLTQTIMITGDSTVITGSEKSLTIDASPDLSYPLVSWQTSDETIATIDENGLINAITPGTVLITATSLYDDTITDTFDLEVVNYILVDETKVVSDSVNYLDIEFEYGINLFSTIHEAIDVATDYATIIVFAGTYDEDLIIDVSNMTLEGLPNAVISGQVVIEADHLQISNLEFTGEAKISNIGNIENLTFNDNTINDITSSTMFMHINGISNLEVKGNTFSSLSGHAIVIENYLGGVINIYGNAISNADTAIKVTAVNDYEATTKVQIERNTIDLVNIGIELQTISSIDIEDYVRFNSVTNYTNLAAKANLNHHVDFTLNYWGNETPVYTDFEDITSYELRGYYSDSSNIISESKYNPLVPVMILPESEELLLEVGDIYAIDYEVLPIGSDPDKIRFITLNPDKVQFQSFGVLKGLESGFTDITLRLSTDFSINAIMSIEVTTDPGIEITPSVTKQDLIVGDALALETMVFPFQIKDELVIYESLNPTVATIDQNGEITSHSAGTVTFVAKLDSDYNVNSEYTIEFHSSLDENNLLDLLTIYQKPYTTHHQWQQYGVTFNYLESRYDSVSRYLFQNIDINTSKLLPITTGIRSGILKPNHPDGITTYNSDNVYWVVVHETANTSQNQGALAHANYLWNAAQAGTALWVSWHYTMDDTYTYQHVPENEIAYHAGDGSSLPGTSATYLGGGNRNGVGIEMSVSQNEDMFLTFQRTAKLSADLLVRYNLPRSHIKFHQDFSGKWCPQGMLRGGMVPVFQELADAEYAVRQAQGNQTIVFESNDLEYVDQTGRVIKMPDRPMTVSYTITVTENNVSTSRTFFTYLPGTMH